MSLQSVAPYLRRFAVSGVVGSAATVIIQENPDDSAAVIFINKIILSVTTHANGQSLTFQDESAVVAALYLDTTVIAESKQGTIEWNFGTKGFKLTVAKDFEVVSSGGGPAASFVVEGYFSPSVN